MPTVADLFETKYGQSLELNRMVRTGPPDGVNFVGRAMRNNGVTARVVLPPGVTAGNAGELTVALGGNGVLSTYVQNEPFVCGRDVMILIPRNADMPLAEKLWWGRCILANRYRYSYGRQANRSLSTLALPAEIPAFVSSGNVQELCDAMVASLRAQLSVP